MAQHAEASRNHESANEVYAPSLTPAIYLVNFLFLYMANPDLAAYLPAYKRLFLNRSSIVWSKIQRAARMLITDNTSKTPTVAVIKTGSASGLTCARSTPKCGAPGARKFKRTWRHQRTIGKAKG